MAIKSFNSIVSDIIDNILIVDPSIDVKVGEVVRDIFIDIQASEIEILYGIANNTSQAQSITTALNAQLDRLGYNYGITRNQAIRSSVNMVISVKAGIQAPTPLNIGDQYNTTADQNNDSIIFINTQFLLLQPGQTLAYTPAIALNPGSNGNVAAYTINNSSYDFVDSIYNPEPSEGGLDQESDAAFALRIPVNVTGQFINTSRGIINSIININDINGTPYFVTSENPQSRGPYTVDVYLQRSANYFGTTVTETAPANQQDYVFLNQPLYSLEPINQITTYDPTTSFTTVIDPSQYTIINDGSDILQNYLGSVQANQMLHWIATPPANPYTISYNYDHTIIDAQAAYDIHNEITADTLFKQATAIPLYISANLAVNSGADFSAINTNANNNLTNLFNSLSITQNSTDKDFEFTILTDRNVQDINLTNLDTTFETTLILPASSGFLTPNNQSLLTPLGYYWEVDSSSPILSYGLVARLWIGKPDVINFLNKTTNGFNFIQSNYDGITNQNNVRVISPSWNTQILPLYDSANSTLILNFTALPTTPNSTLTLNFVQSNINLNNNLQYLTLAPSIISPVEPYASSIQTPNPQYATRLPNGITDISQAILYKNGVQLFETTNTTVNDYTIISGPDSVTGIINIQFTILPSTTDIFQYGILNPNLTISYSSSQFTR